MNKMLWTVLLALALAVPAVSNTCGRCGERTFGTAVQWVNSVPDAARQAQQEQKLVFVLHVSGMFENAGYT